MDVATYEAIGEQADRIDNLYHALLLQLPAQLHIDQMKALLPEIRDALKTICREGGHDFWD